MAPTHSSKRLPVTASFPVGTRVRLHGLAAANRFNGKHGVIIKRAKLLAPGQGAVWIDGEAEGMSIPFFWQTW